MSFEMSELVSIGWASKVYSEHLEKIRTSRSDAESCEVGEKYYPCVDQLFLPPFPAAQAHSRFLVPGAGWKAHFGWAPVDQAERGLDILSRWNALASEGAYYECGTDECLTIVHISDSFDEGTQALAECVVLKSHVGAPLDCVPIAQFSSKSAWIRVIFGYDSASALFGLPEIYFRLYADPLLPVNSVLNSVQKSLGQGSPLSLSAEIRGNSLFGTAAYRVSPILKDWRELVTVPVDVITADFGRIAPQLSHTTIEASLTLYLNRQNTSANSDWHMPSREQESLYAEAIKAGIRDQLSSLCTTPKWRDQVTLECGKKQRLPEAEDK
jgi:hypothetical protein